MSYIGMINDLFLRSPQISFNQRHGIVRIASSLDDYELGDFLVFEVYRLTNPSTYRETYNSWWLKEYTTALIKRQWGQNMLKYSGFTLPSGITLNGREIYQDALLDIEKLEADLFSKATMPPDFFMG
jgi:hypothetical protein